MPATSVHIFNHFFLSDNQVLGSMMKPDQPPTSSPTVMLLCLPQVPTPAPTVTPVLGVTTFLTKEEFKIAPAGKMAVRLTNVAMEGLTDEELSDSGGEGMYRERDEFVVRKEDIEALTVFEVGILAIFCKFSLHKSF